MTSMGCPLAIPCATDGWTVDPSTGRMTSFRSHLPRPDLRESLPTSTAPFTPF